MAQEKAARPCKKCGSIFTKRECPACAAKAAALYYQNKILANPERMERMRAYSRDYSKSHPEERNARRAALRLAEPEKVLEAARKQREKVASDPERLAARRAKNAQYMRDNYEKKRVEREAYRAENSAKIVAQVAEWRRLNPEAIARHANNRRARKLEVGGAISKGLSDRLLILQRGKCACCGLRLGKTFHLDHITPLALGGSNDDSNIQLLRPKCNSQKSAKDPIVFMQERGFLI